MEPETLIFMPNGDVTLRIMRIVMEEEDPETTIEDEQAETTPAFDPEAPAEPDEADDSELFYAPDAPDSETFYPPPRRAARGSDASSRRDRSTSPPASFWSSLKRQKAKLGEPRVDAEPATQTKPVRKERTVLSSHEVLCVVSSRHIMLASKYFESLLSGDSDEATMLRSKKHVSIALSADLDAMVILLNIVHGVSRKVPRQVNLETLRKVATLVSALGMIDAVQFFSDTWIDEFQRKGLPTAYNEKVIALLFVFWVFDRPAEFRNMTKIAQRECDENLDEHVQDIPIPCSIIDAIKKDRETAMESAIAVIHTLINKYLDGKTICDGSWEEELAYACDATVLGSLMKSSRKIGIWPKPEAPFPGRKFNELAQAIRSIRVLDVCKKSSSRRLHLLGPSNNSHGLEDSIEAAIKSIEVGVDGLDLAEYAKKSEEYNLDAQLLHPTTAEVDLDERTNDGMKEEHPGYMKVETEAIRRDYSVTPPAISTQPNPRSLEEAEQFNAKPVPEDYSVKPESPIYTRGRTHVANDPVRKDAVSRNSWNRAAEELVYKEEIATARNLQNQEAQKLVRENETAFSRNSSFHEAKNPVSEQEKRMPADPRQQDAIEHIKQQTKPVLRSWMQEVQEPIHKQPRENSRESQSKEVIKPASEEDRVSPRSSWNQRTKEPVVEQRKASPRDFRSQETRSPPAMVARSPNEQPSIEVKLSTDRRLNTNAISPRDEKAPAQESHKTPRNSPTERVRAIADRSLHRTPSFTIIPKVETRAQQYPVATRASPIEEVRILPDKSSYNVSSSLREEVKPTIPKTVSTDEARVLAEKIPNMTNPFTISDAKTPSSQPLASPIGVSTEEVMDGNRRPTATNPFTRPSNNEVASPLQSQTQTPSMSPRVPSREEVAALTNRKLNATTSFFPDTVKENNRASPQNPLVPSRSTSSEEVSKMRDPSSQVSRHIKAVVVPTLEPRQVPSDALLTTEDEDTPVPPQKFNMRKSKKKFQVKY
ncbi:hypothetical protein D0Z07_3555 [Hyphodiscus hymeniophilus]|uniref:BTB domain-containing protein n=1 Tax=Hyphodiscus hymeniophilus TaxID=353542 RepID=A0A9P6VLT7_9HELO|nr:hypothetical protein D0Z07_3555 [Hyphodiscus hymeniophilus]